MFPYLITYCISLSLINLYTKNKHKRGNVTILLALILLAGLAGMRDFNIGADTNLYVVPFFKDTTFFEGDIFKFLEYNEFTYRFETFYACLNYYVASISNNINFYLFIVHLIIIGVTMYAIKISKVNMTFSIFMFLTIYMAFTLNATRQSIALSFCLLAISILITKGKFRWVILSLIAAYGFHHSAIVFVPIILLYKLIEMKTELFNSSITKFLIITTILILLFSFNQLLVYLGGLGIGEEKYIERYGSSDMYGSNIPISIIALTLFNLFIFYSCKRRIIFRNDKVFTLFSEYILILSCLFCGLALISTFAIRINDYFIYLSLLIIPYYLLKSRSKFLLTTTVCFYIFYWIMTIVIYNLNHTYPYESKILGI